MELEDDDFVDEDDDDDDVKGAKQEVNDSEHLGFYNYFATEGEDSSITNYSLAQEKMQNFHQEDFSAGLQQLSALTPYGLCIKQRFRELMLQSKRG